MKPIRMLLAFVVVAIVAIACRVSEPSLEPHKLGVQPIAYDKATLTGPDASASTVLGSAVGGFDRFDSVSIDCQITTGTGDAAVPLDVYLQKLVATSPDVWIDYVRFPRQTIGLSSASVTYDVASGAVGSPLPVGLGADDAGGVALDAGLVAYGHPGNNVRVVIVTGAGTIYTPASVACYFAGRVH